jgi:hypothetical protein
MLQEQEVLILLNQVIVVVIVIVLTYQAIEVLQEVHQVLLQVQADGELRKEIKRLYETIYLQSCGDHTSNYQKNQRNFALYAREKCIKQYIVLNHIGQIGMEH